MVLLNFKKKLVVKHLVVKRLSKPIFQHFSFFEAKYSNVYSLFDIMGKKSYTIPLFIKIHSLPKGRGILSILRKKSERNHVLLIGLSFLLTVRFNEQHGDSCRNCK